MRRRDFFWLPIAGVYLATKAIGHVHIWKQNMTHQTLSCSVCRRTVTLEHLWAEKLTPEMVDRADFGIRLESNRWLE